MDEFLETYNLPRMNQEETEISGQIKTNETKAVIKNKNKTLPKTKVLDHMVSQMIFTKHSKK